MDHERTEMSRALQHHQDTYDERHLNDDDGFSNLELNGHEKIDEDIMKTNHHHHELAKLHEKNYDVCYTQKKMIDSFIFFFLFHFSPFGQ